MSTIRTRIAPSPTGDLHIGTARAALFNYLFARKLGGKFIIRIEDTDLERSSKEYEKNILDGLEWLGIEADEGPRQGGPFGPYRQSERLEKYGPYLERLLKEEKAFYCFHSKAELEEEKNKLLEIKKPPLHLCEFRHMGLEEAETLKDIKNDFVIRFKNHVGQKVSFNDLIRGEVVFESDLIGDFSLAKSISEPLYNFAVVIDDYEMEISHVIRGEDHIANTPKQILLLEALGLKRPLYAHLPLILGADKSKLSKRHAATSLDDYKNEGYLAEAIFNFISLLGWHPEGDEEVLAKKEIISRFSLERAQKSGAIFDLAKLDWMNGEYIRRKSLAELVELSGPFFKDFLRNPNVQLDRQAGKAQMPNKNLEKIIALEQPRIKKLSELPEKTGYFFKKPEYDKNLLVWKDMSEEEIATSLKKSVDLLEKNKNEDILKIEEIFLEEASREGDRGRILWPLRVALSGLKFSPSPFAIMEILGTEESLERLREALNKLSK